MLGPFVFLATIVLTRWARPRQYCLIISAEFPPCRSSLLTYRISKPASKILPFSTALNSQLTNPEQD